MKKVFHLKTCSTCQKIIKQINWPNDIEFQNIKEFNLTAEELKAIQTKVGTYSDLLNRRAMKYKSMGLAEKDLSEQAIKKLILEEYTFLKRPVVVYDEKIFVGNSKANIEALKVNFGAV